jgi:hypothetical protein
LRNSALQRADLPDREPELRAKADPSPPFAKNATGFGMTTESLTNPEDDKPKVMTDREAFSAALAISPWCAVRNERQDWCGKWDEQEEGLATVFGHGCGLV